MPINPKIKGFATIRLILIGFLLIAGSGYWYYVDDIKPYLNKESDPEWFVGDENRLNNEIQKNSAETVNWLTYRNEKYGFEFKYPSNLEIFIGATSSGEFDVSLVQGDNSIDVGLRIFLNISSASYGPYNSLTEEVEVNKETIGVEKFYSFTGYANMQWQCQNGHTKGELNTKSCSAQKGKDIYQLYFIDIGQFSLAEFDIIVKSFHF